MLLCVMQLNGPCPIKCMLQSSLCCHFIHYTFPLYVGCLSRCIFLPRHRHFFSQCSSFMCDISLQPVVPVLIWCVNLTHYWNIYCLLIYPQEHYLLTDSNFLFHILSCVVSVSILNVNLTSNYCTNICCGYVHFSTPFFNLGR